MSTVLEQLAGLQRQAAQDSQRAAQDSSRFNFEQSNALLKSLTAEGRLTSLEVATFQTRLHHLEEVHGLIERHR